MLLINLLVSYFAPLFLILSPLTSYTDQILAIHRDGTSAGFSLDIPLIMLSASVLKIFYWPGAHYDGALLVQAMIMILVQTLLLKVALDNRPNLKSEQPFQTTGARPSRPYNFWRWRSQQPYWEYLGLIFLGLLACHTYLRQGPDALYTQIIGYAGLTIEALLPIPQLLANQRAQSCKGFRLSVLANWIVGDAMKMGFFFLSEPGKVPWAFKLCGIFQALCDAGLGLQYWLFDVCGDQQRSTLQERRLA